MKSECSVPHDLADLVHAHMNTAPFSEATAGILAVLRSPCQVKLNCRVFWTTPHKHVLRVHGCCRRPLAETPSIHETITCIRKHDQSLHRQSDE